MSLERWGWNDDLARALAEHAQPGMEAGRVLRADRRRYRVGCARGELTAGVAGRLLRAAGRAALPAVGDWVVLKPTAGDPQAIVQAILPRGSQFSRKSAGKSSIEQVVAANVDTVFLMTGLDEDFNLRRLERYVAMGWESGAQPVVLLNKADLCDDLTGHVVAAQASAPGVPVHALSAATGAGIEVLDDYLRVGTTAALLGSSGVGKSTLVNRLLGEERIEVGEIRRRDGRGRHTTTHRELLILPGGGLLIDTPGMRELQLWGDEKSLSSAFSDVDELAVGCRFSDCKHETEPGCAVRAALEAGELAADRLESYHKLQRELASLERRQQDHERRAHRLYRRIQHAKRSRR